MCLDHDEVIKVLWQCKHFIDVFHAVKFATDALSNLSEGK